MNTKETREEDRKKMAESLARTRGIRFCEGKKCTSFGKRLGKKGNTGDEGLCSYNDVKQPVIVNGSICPKTEV
jgi:hypothetical protein